MRGWIEDTLAALLDSDWAVPAVLGGLALLALLFLVTGGGRWPE